MTILKTSLVSNNGYESFIVTFNFQKFTQIQNLPLLFFGTITIEENHVASSMSYVNYVSNNWSILFLAIASHYDLFGTSFDEFVVSMYQIWLNVEPILVECFSNLCIDMKKSLNLRSKVTNSIVC